MQTIYEDNFFVVQFDEEAKLIHNFWTEDTEEMTEEEIKTVITNFIGLLEEKNPTFILSDDSKRKCVYTVDMQEWLGQTMMIVASRLDVTKYGIILPHDLISSISTEQAAEEIVGLPFQLNYFEDVESAKKWFLE